MLLPPAHAKTKAIEVIRITSPERHLTSSDLTGRQTAVWDTAASRQALALVHGLPEGDRKRCFSPGWGIRVHSGTELLFRIAFCFACDGARLWGPEVPGRMEGVHSFDGESDVARELLGRLREG